MFIYICHVSAEIVNVVYVLIFYLSQTAVKVDMQQRASSCPDIFCFFFLSFIT